MSLNTFHLPETWQDEIERLEKLKKHNPVEFAREQALEEEFTKRYNDSISYPYDKEKELIRLRDEYAEWKKQNNY